MSSGDGPTDQDTGEDHESDAEQPEGLAILHVNCVQEHACAQGFVHKDDKLVVLCCFDLHFIVFYIT